jgi:hypothetical protein
LQPLLLLAPPPLLRSLPPPPSKPSTTASPCTACTLFGCSALHSRRWPLHMTTVCSRAPLDAARRSASSFMPGAAAPPPTKGHRAQRSIAVEMTGTRCGPRKPFWPQA